MKTMLRRSWNRTLPPTRFAFGLAFLLACSGAAYLSLASGAPPSLPPITLSDKPLFATSQGDKPAMVLALSVEYPTVGAQYMPAGSSAAAPLMKDSSYSNANEYLGYFDANSCYEYEDSPSETVPAGMSESDLKRFDRTGPATNRKCADAFSGNFLNWASGSAVDVIRMALSGGDRYVDTPELTTLQRAVLPDGSQQHLPCFFNSRNFPAKKLDRHGGGANSYFGAIPAAMRTAAANKDVWVGNILNRIYFAARNTDPATEDCSIRTQYTLGAGVPAPAPGSDGAGPAVIKPPGTALPSPNHSTAGDQWNPPPVINEPQCAGGTTGCTVPWNPVTGQVYEIWYGSGANWSVAIIKNWFNCDAQTFGDPGGGGPKACHMRIPAAGAAAWPPAGTPGLNTEGYFFARVRVCDKKADGTLADERDYNLCKKYPDGGYKPTGAIQKYADQVRLATFGYVMDQTAPQADPLSSFGGVLRTPMKYVGQTTYNDFGAANTGTNPQREWDPQTGAFIANPDSHTSGISGVVNYLNRFGRTNAAAQGRYKYRDPVSELHYEAMRYLQGKQPSTLAIQRLQADAALADGFPAYTSWTDPYGGQRTTTADYSCLRASVVVVGDINTNDPTTRRFNLSTVDDAVNNLDVPDVAAWTSTAVAFEQFVTGASGSSYVDGAGQTQTVSRTPTTLNPSNPLPPGPPMLGTAYWARSHDIRPAGTTRARPGLRVRSMFFDVNEWGESAGAAKETFRRQRNQFFTAAKYGGYETDPMSGNTWGNPFKLDNGQDSESVWQKSDEPGEARTYYLAEDARKVLRAFDDIFRTAATSARSIAGTAVSSQEVTTAGSYAYQGGFNTADWSGDVYAFRLAADASGDLQLSTTPSWQASARLAAMTNPEADRRIFVGPVGASPAAPFKWDRIGADLQQALSRSSPSAATDTLGAARLAYLRGNRSLEGSTFRGRGNLLGDIVNSGVSYLGAPSAAHVLEPGYLNDFYRPNAGRTAAVFVGANDGMLHAFNAATGDELFAYIPGWIAPSVSQLSSPTYEKKAFVDATPTVGEAQVRGNWRSVLVSGTGAGGRGVFALDVSDSAAFDESKVLWEFTNADDPDLGHVVGRPQIVKLRVNDPADATPDYRWFAMVGSGVNNYVPDAAGTFSPTGKPALFLLSLDRQAGEPWCTACAAPNYYKISLPQPRTTATGLINFTAVLGAKREVTAVYAGDLQGQLWKLVFAQRASTDWTVEKLSAFHLGDESSPLPMFVAKDASGIPQPITMAPSLAAGPRVQGVQTALVAFGTGKYLEDADVQGNRQNSFYVLYDSMAHQLDGGSTEAAISGRARLMQGSLGANSVTVPPFTWGLPPLDNDPQKRAGYFFDFASLGERSISNAVISGDWLVFGTLDTQVGTNEPCGPRRGGNQFALNLDDGNGVVRPSDVGVLGTPLVLDLVDKTAYEKSDTTGRRVKTVTSQIVQQGSGGLSGAGGGPGNKVQTTLIAGRLSWRQIHNYREARSAL